MGGEIRVMNHSLGLEDSLEVSSTSLSGFM